ncbi:DUF2235 domain-containing protein [Caballeronia humi]|uniref:T6SS Phospholipase effector Tle1-like catalytic domain-containing protein n=1 Tax=Caballeronia humi TaxID=326474 RepID=A0A158IHJ0_9BURK|nr:DUF2235 domain-containing protein [Caballeronia humi]SAL56016.1 hypothetical protein AWB65_04837 [Caballeronia humi]
MPKNIVFCADGTWNGPNSKDDDNDGIPDTTNVWKAFCTLAGDAKLDSVLLASEQELEQTGPEAQVAKYLHGVGDSRNVAIKLLGGVFGNGIIARIVRGYTYVSRNYEPGDAIILIGFSRGAYTVRALGGMIADVGLLNPQKFDLSDKEHAYMLGINAWRRHREARVKARQNAGGLLGIFSALMRHLPQFAFDTSEPDDTVPVDSIKAIGVWDTVGSLGIPLYLGANGSDVDVFRFADTALSNKVAFGVHALSLDEQRSDFTPTFWDARDGITQALFAGAHADVGGGYPTDESGLSDIACTWMLERLGDPAIGLHVKPQPWAFKPDFFGMGHEPWTQPPFNLLPKGPRTPIPFPKDVGAHISIAHRMGIDPKTGQRVAVTLKYLPTALAEQLGTNMVWMD